MTLTKPALLIILVVLMFIAAAAGSEVGDRLCRLEPRAAGKILFSFVRPYFVAKYWNEVKYPFLVSLVSGLVATTVLVILVFS